VVGSGPSGVVLANQSNSTMCTWWPFADVLVRRGFRVLLFDFRCTGESECPEGSAAGDYIADVAGAAAALRSNGASKVALMGASLGGNVAMSAAPSIRPRVSAVLSLSGPADLSEPLNDPRLNAFEAVPKLTSPFFQMVARDDPVAFIPQLRKLERTAGSKVSQLVVLDASYGHGVNMITTIAGDPTDAAAQVIDFLRTHG